jgi:hypothetical protein
MGGGDTLCVWSQLGSNESLLVDWCQHFGRKYWQLRQYIFCTVGTDLPDCAVSEHRRINTLYLTRGRSDINVVNFMLLHSALRSPPPKHAVPSYSSTSRPFPLRFLAKTLITFLVSPMNVVCSSQLCLLNYTNKINKFKMRSCSPRIVRNTLLSQYSPQHCVPCRFHLSGRNVEACCVNLGASECSSQPWVAVRRFCLFLFSPCRPTQGHFC